MENLNDFYINKLLPYQVPHVYQLYESFGQSSCVLDASDTGTGKTYTTIALCGLLNLKPFVICPKSVINSWINVAKEFNIEMRGISNYEKMQGCKYYTPSYEIANCPYVDKYLIAPKNKQNDNKSKNDKPIESKKKKKDKYGFIFQLPHDTIVIIDEAHRCKNHKTINSTMLQAFRDSKTKILLLSATITDKIDCFKPFGVVFGLYDNVKKYNMWIRNKLKIKKIMIEHMKKKNKNKNNDNHHDDEYLTDGEIQTQIIHNAIFPKMGCRMKIKELGDLFPQNQVIAKCYYSEDHASVDKLYILINDALEDLKKKEMKSVALGQIVRCRMRIEMYKLPIMLDLVDDALNEGYSVAIFVNFKDSMNYLAHHLSEECSLIHGDQTLEDRDYNIENFQTNKTKVIISIIQAGGVGISLHDLYGRPRISLISPSWSGTDVVQALGRIHRAKSKSPALQRIIYIAESYEEEICKKLTGKLTVLSGINDGDLVGPRLNIEKLKEDGHLDIINQNVTNLQNINNNDNNNTIKKANFVKVESNEETAFEKKPEIQVGEFKGSTKGVPDKYLPM